MNQPTVEPLIELLSAAVELRDPAFITKRIKSDLSELIHSRRLKLPDRYRQPRSECYARRLLHRDPWQRYSVVVMTWGPGQGTPLHDHAGTWCVEAVVEGEMEITQFDLIEDSGKFCRFERKTLVQACVGSSGCLIPPFEYHTLRNAFQDRPSITLHVYGGDMDQCCAFEPRDGGWYKRVERSLPYHE